MDGIVASNLLQRQNNTNSSILPMFPWKEVSITSNKFVHRVCPQVSIPYSLMSKDRRRGCGANWTHSLQKLRFTANVCIIWQPNPNERLCHHRPFVLALECHKCAIRQVCTDWRAGSTSTMMCAGTSCNPWIGRHEGDGAERGGQGQFGGRRGVTGWGEGRTGVDWAQEGVGSVDWEALPAKYLVQIRVAP